MSPSIAQLEPEGHRTVNTHALLLASGASGGHGTVRIIVIALIVVAVIARVVYKRLIKRTPKP
jgi:hypothetical protein